MHAHASMVCVRACPCPALLVVSPQLAGVNDDGLGLRAGQATRLAVSQGINFQRDLHR